MMYSQTCNIIFRCFISDLSAETKWIVFWLLYISSDWQFCVHVFLWRLLFLSLSLCTRLLFSLSLLPQFRRPVTLGCLHPRTDKHYVTSLCKQKSSVDEQSPWSQVHIRAPTQTDAYIRNINVGGPDTKPKWSDDQPEQFSLHFKI